jgi:hypothetical protein
LNTEDENPKEKVKFLKGGGAKILGHQTWHMSRETIVDFSPLNAFLSILIGIPCKNNTVYYSQNNDALIKELNSL